MNLVSVRQYWVWLKIIENLDWFKIMESYDRGIDSLPVLNVYIHRSCLWIHVYFSTIFISLELLVTH